MTTTEPATSTATVSAADFMRAVTNAALSASTDDTLPMLSTVHFRPGHTAGTLMLEATNRCVASQEEIPLADLDDYDSDWDRSQLLKHLEDDHGITRPEGHDPRSTEAVAKEHELLKHGPADDVHTHTVRPVPETELDVLVNAKDLGKLVRTLKLVIEPETKNLTGNASPHVVITHTEGTDKVAFTLVNNLGTDTTVSPRQVLGDYVKIDQLMDAALLPADELAAKLAKQEADRMNPPATKYDWERPAYVPEPRDVPDVWERRWTFNPDFLAIFTKVDPGERGVQVEFNFTATGKPVLVKIGPSYRALIVPITNRA